MAEPAHYAVLSAGNNSGTVADIDEPRINGIRVIRWRRTLKAAHLMPSLIWAPKAKIKLSIDLLLGWRASFVTVARAVDEIATL